MKTEKNYYSILLVDDHQMMLDGISKIINEQELYQVEYMANSGTSAKKILQEHAVDILITDYQMPDFTGKELIQFAKSRYPEIKSMIMSMHDDYTLIREVLQMGVDAYILKNDSHQSILAALNKVTLGKRYLSEEVADILIQGNDVAKTHALSPREEEIVKLITQEYSTKQIAEQLCISERTVETHRKNILRKTGVSSLVGLVKYAYEHNLIMKD